MSAAGEMIRIRQAGFTYDGADTPTVTGIDLTVHAGECVVLTGPSGGGKTTVTRMANGLIPHFYEGRLTGSVQVRGLDITQNEPHVFSRMVGSVFQNPRSQFFNTDTDSEIVFGMENAGIPRPEMKRRYADTVRQLDIGHLTGRDIFQLSGGEKQMVACGSVHAMQPDIYVLDEPSSNLDEQAVQRLRQFLKLVKEEGKTILIAEHRLYYLRDIADRVIRMDQGRMKEAWTGRELGAMDDSMREAWGLRSFAPTPLPRVEREARMDGAPLLQVRGLSCGYNRPDRVFRQMSFSLYAGEIVGLLGENGQGKTTLARTLCGLHRQWEGEIWIGGRWTKPRRRQKLCSLVMQDPNYQLFSDSVEEELLLCAREADRPEKERVDGLLRQLSLYTVRGQHPMALSGGQKQRLCVALAAVSPAKILIFDEPTSGLDFCSMRAVAELLQLLAGLGKTIMVISHDYEFLHTACGRFLQMEREGSMLSGEQAGNRKQEKGYASCKQAQ